MEIYNDTYCVYIHTNKINGKRYVGQTINGNNINKRWSNGLGYKTCTAFYRAIQKYGWDSFEHEIVASNLTKEEANNFEIILINKLNTNNQKFGYNISKGGNDTSYAHTLESRLKQSETMKKLYLNKEYIQKMRDCATKTPVCQFSEDGKFIASYISTKEAERQTGISSGGISNCAIGNIPSSKGFIWIFPEDIDNIQERVEEYKNKKIHIETIVQLTYDFKFIKGWQNAAQAGRELSINYKNIHSVCNHKRNKAGGYRWMYLSEYNNLIKTTQN